MTIHPAGSCSVCARSACSRTVPVPRMSGCVLNCGPVAPVSAGGNGAARAADGADRRAAGLPPGHGAPLDQPVKPRGNGRAGRPAPVRAPPARRAPADQADRRAAGPARTVDAAADSASIWAGLASACARGGNEAVCGCVPSPRCSLVSGQAPGCGHSSGFLRLPGRGGMRRSAWGQRDQSEPRPRRRRAEARPAGDHAPTVSGPAHPAFEHARATGLLATSQMHSRTGR